MTVILGDGEHRYRVEEGWGKVPEDGRSRKWAPSAWTVTTTCMCSIAANIR